MLPIYFKAYYKSAIVLLLSLAAASVQADPPRPLNTSFADYAQQQKQHDTQLQQATTAPVTTTQNTSTVNASAASGSKPKPVKSAVKAGGKSSTPININQADEASLSNSLNGIGPAKARAIVEYRREHGNFKRVDDIVNVKGIGPATLEKNRQLIRLN